MLSSDVNRALDTLNSIPEDLLTVETELTRYQRNPSVANQGPLRESIDRTLAEGEQIDTALGVIERSLADMRRRLQTIVAKGTRSMLGRALYRSAVDSERQLEDGIEQIRTDRAALKTWLRETPATSMRTIE